MVQIIDYADTGKTETLLRVAKENNGIVVCKRPDRMMEKARSYGIGAVECISYDEFLALESTSANYYIDELENLLALYSLDIKGYTITLKK